jgi:hypothetical protein
LFHGADIVAHTRLEVLLNSEQTPNRKLTVEL